MNARVILLVLYMMIGNECYSQAFNLRISFSNADAEEGKNCYELDNDYVFFATYSDTLGFTRSGNIFLNHEGIFEHESIIHTDSTIMFLGYYGSTDQFENGFVSCGMYHTPPYDALTKGEIILFNELGDTIWTKVVEPDAGEGLYFSKALKVDDGIVICGSSVPESGLEQGLLMKFDYQGEFLWRKDYVPTTTTALRLVSAVSTPTGGFLLGGASMAPFNWNHLIIKTDDEGTQVWRKFQGDEFSNYYAMVCNTVDGKYIFGGQDKNAEQFEDASQVTKMNTNGTIGWTQTYGDYGPDCVVFAIKQMPDGGFIFCGSDRSSWSHFGYICRIDSQGQQLWYRKYQQTEGNWAYLTDVIHTTDNGYLLTGSLYADPGLSQDIWALKLDSLGCLIPGCAVGIIEEGESAAMRIYPNPADDFINVFVESKSLHNCELNLYDMQGREIYCTTIRESGNTWMMDSSILAEGIYLLNLLLNGEVVKSEKVVVRH